jgi:hypothetical protein
MSTLLGKLGKKGKDVGDKAGKKMSNLLGKVTSKFGKKDKAGDKAAMDSDPAQVAAGGRTKFESLHEPVGIMSGKMWRMFKNTLKGIPAFIVQTQIVITSSVVLIAVVIIITIIIILLMYIHPRPAFFNRYSNADAFKDKFGGELKRSMKVAAMSPPPSYIASEASAVSTAVATLMSGGNFEKHLGVYLMFEDAIVGYKKSTMRKAFAIAGFKAAKVFTNANGDFIFDKMEKFHTDFSKNIKTIATSVASMRKTCDKRRAQDKNITDMDPQDHEYIKAVYDLDLMLNQYMPVAMQHFANRTADNKNSKSVNFIVFSRYFVPLADDMWVQGIVNTFKGAGAFFVNVFKFCDNLWIKVGEMIARLPMMMAPDAKKKKEKKEDGAEAEDGGDTQDNPDGEEGAGGNAEGFTQPTSSGCQGCDRNSGLSKTFGEDEEARVLEHYDKPASDDANPMDVVEHFGALFSLVKSIGVFFSSFLPVGLQLLMYIQMLFSEPFKAIMGIIMLLFVVALSILLMLVYTILTLPILFGCSAAWAFFGILSIGLTCTYTFGSLILRTGIVVVMLVVFLIIWLIDLITNGMIVRMLQCEEDPDAPEFRTHMQDRNGYMRYTMTCLYPCFSGYRPLALKFLGNTPTFCRRMESSRPNFCPQQQLLRFFRGRGLAKPYMFDMYKPTLFFNYYNEDKRRQIIKDTFKERGAYLKSCSKAMDPRFAHIARHVCTNLKNFQYANDSERAGVQQICKQIFCEDKTNKPGYKSVCKYLSKDATDDDSSMGGDPFGILKKALMLGIVALTILVVIIAFVRATAVRAEALKTASN